MIENVLTSPVFQYVVKVNAGCGNVQRFFQGGVLTENYQFPPGAQLSITTDDETKIDKYYKVELRKCRMGLAAQEFTFRKGDDDDGEIIIVHKGTGSPLTTLMGAATPFVNITQVWEDGIFDGSGDYYVSVILNPNENANCSSCLSLNLNDFQPFRRTILYICVSTCK